MINIIDRHSLLSPAQINLLQQCSSVTFHFGKFDSLDDILTRLNVDVIIETGCPRRTVPSDLDKVLEYWDEEANRIECQIPKDKSKFEDYKRVRDIIRDIKEQKEYWPQMFLRGLYDPSENSIILYPEVMLQEHGGNFMDELLVSTLAHETMHAYFNRPRHKSYPYVIFVEEPLAEFGMLLYLHETNPNYYQWAYKDVKNKKTCYRYGADLMVQYLSEGVASPIRKFLERYKIRFDATAIPTINASRGVTILPQIAGSRTSSVVFNGIKITTRWKDLFKNPPRYFYDPATKTLGLDGFWGRHMDMRSNHVSHIFFNVDFYEREIDMIYLGDDFEVESSSAIGGILSKAYIIVSPKNKKFSAKKGMPVYKQNNKPVLSSCGKGFYKLCRNGKWGVVDEQLNEIIPCKYDFIWSFDKNDLVMVRLGNKYGLVNKHGDVKVKVIYDDITENDDPSYTVKQGNKEYKIDNHGKELGA